MRKSTSIWLLLAASLMEAFGLFIKQHVVSQIPTNGTGRDETAIGQPYTPPTDFQAP